MYNPKEKSRYSTRNLAANLLVKQRTLDPEEQMGPYKLNKIDHKGQFSSLIKPS